MRHNKDRLIDIIILKDIVNNIEQTNQWSYIMVLI